MTVWRALMGVCGCAVWDGPRRLGSWNGEAVEVDEPAEIVDEVGHADLQLGAGDSDGSDEEVHLVFLHREDMLDAGADLGLEGVGAARGVRHRPTRRLLAMDAADEAVPFEERFVRLRAVGRVGPHRARGVGLVEQPFTQPRALISRSVGCVPAPDQPMLAIDRDVVLVAECRDGDVDRRNRPVRARLGLAELDRPARVAVLVPELGGLGLPGLGNASVLDGLLFLLGVALLGRGDQRSVDDLAAHGDVTGLAQRRVEPVEQRLQALVNVEKPRLTAHRLTPLHQQRRNQKLRLMARFLEPSSWPEASPEFGTAYTGDICTL